MTKDLFPSPTPLTPPHHEEDWLSWLRLLRSRRVGPSTFYRLMNEHGSAEAALDALPGIARKAGVSNYQPCTRARAAAELTAARLAGARAVAIGAPDYPAGLAATENPPPLLWILGDPALLRRPMVALVGARNASSLGTRMARTLAGELADAGYVVVSGLARGIDAAAHFGALERGTLAVMAGGVDAVYPAENAVLAQEIAERGVRLSEQPMGLQPIARHFPQRNRIVAGLCRAVVVVEAAARSGSLITASQAADLGREVMAVPGHPFDGRAAGCNFLLRDGATLVRSAADVIAVCEQQEQETPEPAAGTCGEPPATRPAPDPGPRAVRRAATTPPEKPLRRKPAPQGEPSPRPEAKTGETTLAHANRLHNEILSRLSPSPVTEDQLVRDLKLRVAELSPALLDLELDGKIIRQPGGMVSLSPHPA